MGVLYRYNASTGLAEPVLPVAVTGDISYCRVAYSGGGNGASIPPGSVDTIVPWTSLATGIQDMTSDYQININGGITVANRGFYMCTGSIRWDNSVTGQRRSVGFMVNSTVKNWRDDAGADIGGNFNSQQIFQTYYLKAGDSIYLMANQNSGSTLSIIADSVRSWMTIARVGSNEGILADYAAT